MYMHLSFKNMYMSTYWHYIPWLRATVIEFCISGLAVISVTGLSCMHTWLIARMETTNEDVSYVGCILRQSRCPKKNPPPSPPNQKTLYETLTVIIDHVSLCTVDCRSQLSRVCHMTITCLCAMCTVDHMTITCLCVHCRSHDYHVSVCSL